MSSSPETSPRAEAGAAPKQTGLRGIAARGTIINSAFQAGLALVGFVQRLAIAAFLTRDQFGLWGILLAVLITLAWLKQVGIADKYIQQSEEDQEAAFQKAFTLELALSVGYMVLCCAALPFYAIAYGHDEIILPGMILSTVVVLSAVQAVTWIPYRRLQYARQRVLTSVDPLVSTAASIALTAAGYGYWGLVVGSLVGSLAGAIVCLVASPYRLRLRFERDTLRQYASFSWPLVGLGVSRLLVVQGSFLAANRTVGLAGVAAIGLATSFAVFADRVNAIVSQTIYPAVCKVTDRADLMREVFVKSNRVSLMWAVPFGVGLALFAGDLVDFVLGSKWDNAVGLLAAFGLICGLGQLAFNWTIFMRAIGRTRPLFTAALLDLTVFFAIMLPATLKYGLTGYAVGFAASGVVQIAVRTFYMRELFVGFSITLQAARAITPVLAPVALVLLMRWVEGPSRSLAMALAELLLYVVSTVACTYLLERQLIAEMLGYLRRKANQPPPTQVTVRA